MFKRRCRMKLRVFFNPSNCDGKKFDLCILRKAAIVSLNSNDLSV